MFFLGKSQLQITIKINSILNYGKTKEVELWEYNQTALSHTEKHFSKINCILSKSCNTKNKTLFLKKKPLSISRLKCEGGAGKKKTKSAFSPLGKELQTNKKV